MSAIPASIDDFEAVYVIDSEYVAELGERVEPVCFGVCRWGEAEIQTYTRKELLTWRELPYPCGERTLTVNYNGAAESSVLEVLGLPQPCWWLDLMAESRHQRNVCIRKGEVRRFQEQHPEIMRPNEDATLLQTCDFYGVEGGNSAFKDMGRELVTSRAWESDDPGVWGEIRAYCASDVVLTVTLLTKMLPHIGGLQPALLRGRFARDMGIAEMRGIPVDVALLERMRAQHQGIMQRFRERVDRDGTRLTPRGKVSQRWLPGKLAAIGMQRRHQMTPGGRPSLKARALAETAAECGDEELGEIAQWAEMLAIFQEKKGGGLRLPTAGRDGRARYSVLPYGTHTGRAVGLGPGVVPQLPKWTRGLIQPAPGEVIIGADYVSQEYAIAAGLSGDANMQALYMQGDPYLAMAHEAGAVKPGMTDAEVRKVRGLFKTLVLGKMYGLGLPAFRRSAGVSFGQATHAWKYFETRFAKFRAWQVQIVRRARQRGRAVTSFGWSAQVYPNTRQTSLLNWFIQAAGADTLHVAVTLLGEAGLSVVMTAHDGLLVSSPECEWQDQVREVERVMGEASEVVVHFPVRVELQTVLPGERLLTAETAVQWQRVLGVLGED